MIVLAISLLWTRSVHIARVRDCHILLLHTLIAELASFGWVIWSLRLYSMISSLLFTYGTIGTKINSNPVWLCHFPTDLFSCIIICYLEINLMLQVKTIVMEILRNQQDLVHHSRLGNSCIL